MNVYLYTAHITYCLKAVNNSNSCYWSGARCQIFLCLERHTNEAKGSIQSRTDPFASLACQTADNYDKSYSWVSFSFLYGYGAPLGGPPLRLSRKNREAVWNAKMYARDVAEDKFFRRNQKR